jgi:hypothetical protein
MKIHIDKEYRAPYQHYKGDIWISQQDDSKDIQGTNIAIIDQDDRVRVLGYIRRIGDKWDKGNGELVSLEEKVWQVLKSYGWADRYCHKLLGEKEKA